MREHDGLRGRSSLPLGLAMVLAATASVGCRAKVSPLPPIRVNRDMFQQPKNRPESDSMAFPDGAAMRPIPRGALSQEEFNDDDGLKLGTSKSGYLVRLPLPVDRALLDRGEERYGIFCAPCHDRAGSGQGVMVKRGFPPPVDLSSDHSRALRDGELFHIIGFGVRNMPGYRNEIPVLDRWAITAWVRVLQQSQHAVLADLGDDVPTDIRKGPMMP